MVEVGGASSIDGVMRQLELMLDVTDPRPDRIIAELELTLRDIVALTSIDSLLDQHVLRNEQ